MAAATTVRDPPALQVTACRGTDAELGHGFSETKQGLRYAVGAPARREVPGRLRRLSHEGRVERAAPGERHATGQGTRGTQAV